jgi:hypothetical protein
LKRLGADKRDAEEIKEHEFFKGIDWVAVSQKKLEPPKPEIREIKQQDIPYSQIFNELKAGQFYNEEYKLPGWSFAVAHDKAEPLRTI